MHSENSKSRCISVVSRGYLPFMPDDTSTMEAEKLTFFFGDVSKSSRTSMARTAKYFSMPDDTSTLIAGSTTFFLGICSESSYISTVRIANSLSMPADTSTSTAKSMTFFLGNAFCRSQTWDLSMATRVIQSSMSADNSTSVTRERHK
jgi:hypothetical protein